MVVVGGMGTLIGPVAGAILLTILPELLRDIGDLRLVVYGLSLTLVVLFMPGGIVQAVRLAAARLRALGDAAMTAPRRRPRCCRRAACARISAACAPCRTFR